MKDVLFYLSTIAVSLLVLWRILDFFIIYIGKPIFERLKLLSIKQRFLYVGGFLLVGVSLPMIIAWQNVSVKEEEYVTITNAQNEGFYVVHGNIARIVEEFWEVSTERGNLEKGAWSGGLSFIYDLENQLVEKIYHQGMQDSLMQKEDYEKRARYYYQYNDDNKLKLTEYYDEKGKFNNVIKNHFDEEGALKYRIRSDALSGKRLNSATVWTSVNDMEHYTIYDKDKLRHEIRSQYWKSSGEYKERKYYKTDKNDREWRYTEQKYDQRGALVSEKAYHQDSSNVVSNYVEAKRDKNSRLISLVEDGHHWIPYYQSFDKQGNWTQMIWIKDGSPIEMITRRIEYYEEDNDESLVQTLDESEIE